MTEKEKLVAIRNECRTKIDKLERQLEKETENKERLQEDLENYNTRIQELEREIKVLEADPENIGNTQEIYVKDKKIKIYKSSEKASIIGDTVGDPMKDTSGPSLNILIKLSSIISVVFGTLFVNTSYLLK